MFVDASALVAILTKESDADELTDKLEAAGLAMMSPLVRYETVLSVARKQQKSLVGENALLSASHLGEAEEHLAALISEAGASEMPITSDIGAAAIQAMARYGRGTGHPAKLNFGDCFSYACAKSAGVPLLFKGEDFIHTDIEAA